MRTDIQIRDVSSKLAITGRLNGVTAGQFLEFIAMNTARIRKGELLTLDLCGVSHVECSGICVIMRGYKLAQLNGAERPIQVLARGEVADLLEATKLKEVLQRSAQTATRSKVTPLSGIDYCTN